MQNVINKPLRMLFLIFLAGLLSACAADNGQTRDAVVSISENNTIVYHKESDFVLNNWGGGLAMGRYDGISGCFVNNLGGGRAVVQIGDAVAVANGQTGAASVRIIEGDVSGYDAASGCHVNNSEGGQVVIEYW